MAHPIGAPALTPLDKISDHLMLARAITEEEGLERIRLLIEVVLADILFTSQSYGEAGTPLSAKFRFKTD